MNIFLIQLPSPYLVVVRIQERFVQIKSIQTPIKPVICPLTPFSYPCRSNVKKKKKKHFIDLSLDTNRFDCMVIRVDSGGGGGVLTILRLLDTMYAILFVDLADFAKNT